MKFLQLIFAVSFLALFTSCKESSSSLSNGVEPKEVTEAGLSWYKIDDLDQMDLGDKKVMIDMYTSWCGWCKVMDKKTFTDPQVCLLYTSPSPRDLSTSRMPSSA